MKMFLLIILTFVILFETEINAQECRWAIRAGGISNDNINGFDIDKSGNSYITGVFFDTLEFENTKLISSDLWAVYLAKYDNKGSLIWAKIVCKDTFVLVNCLKLNNYGNITIVGNYKDTLNLGLSNIIPLSSNGDHDAFIATFDNKGELLWAKSIGEMGYDNINSICSSKNGELIVAGEFHYSSYYNSASSIYIAKYDSFGNQIWLRASQSYENGHYTNDIKVDSNGNCYLTGSFFNTIEFEPTAVLDAGNIESNAFIVKYDSNGFYIWSKAIGSASGYAGAKCIEIDPNGNSYIGGFFRGTINLGQLNLSSTSGMAYEFFITKLDSLGNFVWANQSNGVGAVKNISYNNSNNIYISGLFNNIITFDPFKLNTKGSNDIFIVKINDNGKYLFANSFGGINSDVLSGFKSNDNGLFLCGNFINEISFGNLVKLKGKSNINTDLFLTKFDFPSSIDSEENYNFELCFPNPANQSIYFNNCIGEKIKIYNSLGQLVYNKSLNSDKIDISNLVIGSYNLILKDKLYKFVKY